MPLMQDLISAIRAAVTTKALRALTAVLALCWAIRLWNESEDSHHG